jgi:hypothetical protein
VPGVVEGAAVPEADADADADEAGVVPEPDAEAEDEAGGVAVGVEGAAEPVVGAVGPPCDALGAGLPEAEAVAVDVGVTVGKPVPGNGNCPQPAAIPLMTSSAEALMTVLVSLRRSFLIGRSVPMTGIPPSDKSD